MISKTVFRLMKNGMPVCASRQDVALTGLAAIAPEDPEPEFVKINRAGVAVVISGYFGVNPPGFVAQVVAFAFGTATAMGATLLAGIRVARMPIAEALRAV